MDVIGFSGEMGSGKSTCTNYFIERGYYEFRFADPIKNLVHKLFDTSHESVYGDSKFRNSPIRMTKANMSVSDRDVVSYLSLGIKEIESYLLKCLKTQNSYSKFMYENFHENQIVSVRTLLQLLGTEFRNQYLNSSAWVAVMTLRVKSSPYKNIVISDIRSKDEVELVNWIGRSVRLKRDVYPRLVGIPGHSSENIPADDNYAIVIDNNGTIGALNKKLFAIYSRCKVLPKSKAIDKITQIVVSSL